MPEIFLQWAHFTSHWVFYSNCRDHLSYSVSKSPGSQWKLWSLENIQFGFILLLSIYRRERCKIYSNGRMLRSCIKQNLLAKSVRCLLLWIKMAYLTLFLSIFVQCEIIQTHPWISLILVNKWVNLFIQSPSKKI